MFCPYCKKEIEDDSLFCSFCGSRIEQQKSKEPQQSICDHREAALEEEAASCSVCGTNIIGSIGQQPNTKKITPNFKWINVAAAAFLVVIALIVVGVTSSRYGRYEKAVGLVQEKKYAEAADAFSELHGYKNSDRWLYETKYREGIARYEAGEYLAAKDAFDAVLYYKNASEWYDQSLYMTAVLHFNLGLYSDAIYYFNALGDYSDSKARKETAMAAYYQQGYDAIFKEDYATAKEIFTDLSEMGYHGSDAVLKEIDMLEKEIAMLEYATNITFDDLSRFPDDYKGKKVTFYGKVVQVMEVDDEIHVRLAISGNYNMIIYSYFSQDLLKNGRILEDDYITVYGTARGLHSYTATLGKTITLPLVEGEILEQY